MKNHKDETYFLWKILHKSRLIDEKTLNNILWGLKALCIVQGNGPWFIWVFLSVLSSWKGRYWNARMNKLVLWNYFTGSSDGGRSQNLGWRAKHGFCFSKTASLHFFNIPLWLKNFIDHEIFCFSLGLIALSSKYIFRKNWFVT